MHTINTFFKNARAFALLLLIITLSSCVTHYSVKVNGFLSDNLEVPEKPKIFVYTNPQSLNPILAQQITGKISNLLLNSGYSVVNELQDSDTTLLFEIGLGDTITSIGSRNKLNVHTGKFENVATSSTKHLRYLNLYYYISENLTKTSMPIWIGEIRSYGSSTDLRVVSDYLILAGFEHFLENTKKELNKTYLPGDKKLNILENKITKVENNN
jgi:hypothetical protein